jgi:hypothetical protein
VEIYCLKRPIRMWKHPWEGPEEDQTCAGRTLGSKRRLLVVVVLGETCVYACDGKCQCHRQGVMTRRRGELGGSRVCACAARPCARAYRRCQRQRRVEHPITALGGAAAQRQRIVRRDRDARTRLSRRTPNPRYNRHRARVHLRGVHEVGVQGASRVRPGGDGGTFKL